MQEDNYAKLVNESEEANSNIREVLVEAEDNLGRFCCTHAHGCA